MPEMITTALEDAKAKGLKGLEPKEIAQFIIENIDPDARGEAVSSICWRMWKRGELVKDKDSPLYRLPTQEERDRRAAQHDMYERMLAVASGEAPKEKAPDAQSSPDTSEAFDQPEAQGREAGPGGGA